MKYFSFERLIKKYSSEFTAYIPHSDGGYADNGEYVKATVTEMNLTGAILSLSEAKLLRAEGNLTSNDRVLFMLTSLDFPLEGAFIVYKDKKYYIESGLENSEFTGVWQYNLKYVSAFKAGDEID